jgi:hypothetical protein
VRSAAASVVGSGPAGLVTFAVAGGLLAWPASRRWLVGRA